MKTYKAISLQQPWANLVVEGKKIIETRTWDTKYRGDIVICSSKKPDIYPAGYALCIVELYDTRRMKKEDEKDACCKVYPHAHSWFLRNIRRFKKPIPIQGKLGIYTIQLPQLK